MLETPHVVVGAAIATKFPNPLIAIPLSFLSHFALERVPHWNPHLNTETQKYGKPTKITTIIVVIDVILSLSFGLFIAINTSISPQHFWTILASCFASVLPDVIEGPYFFLKLRNKGIKTWIKFQKSIQVDTSIVPGLLTQVITILAAFWWMF